MPPSEIESVFLSGGLIWQRGGNGAPGGIGTTEANIARWQGQFKEKPEPKKEEAKPAEKKAEEKPAEEKKAEEAKK